MCGIFCFIGKNSFRGDELSKIEHRGPDSMHCKIHDNIFFGFNRLMINGLDHESDQPIETGRTILICNGEIYNFRELYRRFDIEDKQKTHSDCEVICHIYEKVGFDKMIKSIEGEFAFCLYDKKIKKLYVSRDPIGVRGLVIGKNENGDVGFCSELKGLHQTFELIKQFPPGYYWDDEVKFFSSYFIPKIDINPSLKEESVCQRIKSILERAVMMRVKVTDRKVGSCLSGGIDSSLVTSIASRYFEKPSDLNTFSIGLLYHDKDGKEVKTPDLYYAKKVADFLGTNHHEVIFTEEEFLSEIPETIRVVESYDITTVRASVGHRLISKWVSENTDVKVLLSSDIPDEVCPGYKYLSKIDDRVDFFEEILKLIYELHNFDLMRTDRCISAYGLEGRCPFSDLDFIKLFMMIPFEMRRYPEGDEKIEKYLLRNAFREGNYLPEEVLWRPKEAFSNGVSHENRDWATIIKEYVDELISDEEFETKREKYDPIPPTKEAYWYREVFESHYPGRGKFIPHYWMPNQKYCKVDDPSARVISSD